MSTTADKERLDSLEAKVKRLEGDVFYCLMTVAFLSLLVLASRRG